MERFSFVYSLIGYDENLHCSMIAEKSQKPDKFLTMSRWIPWV